MKALGRVTFMADRVRLNESIFWPAGRVVEARPAGLSLGVRRVSYGQPGIPHGTDADEGAIR